MKLKPSESIVVATLVALGVLTIFSKTAPDYANVKASAVGGAASANTHKSVKMAIYESAALVVGVAVLARDPAVYVVGGAVTVFEGWKYYAANSTDMASGAVVAPGSATSGQPVPVLNQ